MRDREFFPCGCSYTTANAYMAPDWDRRGCKEHGLNREEKVCRCVDVHAYDIDKYHCKCECHSKTSEPKASGACSEDHTAWWSADWQFCARCGTPRPPKVKERTLADKLRDQWFHPDPKLDYYDYNGDAFKMLAEVARAHFSESSQ